MRLSSPLRSVFLAPVAITLFACGGGSDSPGTEDSTSGGQIHAPSAGAGGSSHGAAGKSGGTSAAGASAAGHSGAAGHSAAGGGLGVGTGGASPGAGGGHSTGGSGHSSPEICNNGIDDNGDGHIDEGCDCQPGASQKCFVGDGAKAGKGICNWGSQTCMGSTKGEVQSTAWTACTGSGAPAPETCDGKDNDCDGQVDDGLSMACSSACGAGTEVCTDGKWGACSAPTPSMEVCNGKDDDCNGFVDDGIPGEGAACQTGQPGACGSGTSHCTGGAMVCTGGTTPTTETCNGLDDDCNGQIDDGISCKGGTLCVGGSNSSQSPWQIHLGNGPQCFGQTFGTHGDAGEYALSSIPGPDDPAWSVASAQDIGFNDPSTLCGTACECSNGGDFTYFQTFFVIPVGYTVSSLVVSVGWVDDGVRVTVFNSANPGGVVDPGSYVYLGGNGTTNLAQLIVPGENRIVMTHVDDCCSVRGLTGVTIQLNGSALPQCM